MLTTVPELLLFGYGNPGRGDDALGPLLIESIDRQQFPRVECLTDMQLQIEHVTDLQHRKQIIFIDADMSCEAPFACSRLEPEMDDSYTSHAMTPAALLHAYRQVYGTDAPPAYLLRIRGYDFDLGDPLSDGAAKNLNAATDFVRALTDTADALEP